MAFPESVRREARRLANYRCVVCQMPWVEVHHIIPEAQGGPDTLDNAAPLCATCHHVCGGNPELRKQLREMRDHWWGRCEETKHVTHDAGLAEKVDCLLTQVTLGQKKTDDALGEVKNLVVQNLNMTAQQVLASGSVMDVFTAVRTLGSGVPPPTANNQPYPPRLARGEAYRFEPLSPNPPLTSD